MKIVVTFDGGFYKSLLRLRFAIPKLGSCSYGRFRNPVIIENSVKISCSQLYNKDKPFVLRQTLRNFSKLTWCYPVSLLVSGRYSKSVAWEVWNLLFGQHAFRSCRSTVGDVNSIKRENKFFRHFYLILPGEKTRWIAAINVGRC